MDFALEMNAGDAESNCRTQYQRTCMEDRGWGGERGQEGCYVRREMPKVMTAPKISAPVRNIGVGVREGGGISMERLKAIAAPKINVIARKTDEGGGGTGGKEGGGLQGERLKLIGMFRRTKRNRPKISRLLRLCQQ